MITHRNAWMNSIGTLVHQPMTCADRYLWTLPMFHANGWTFVWTVTAVGRDARLSAKSRSARGLRIDGERADHHALRRADGFDSLANAPEDFASSRRREFALSPPVRRPPPRPSRDSKKNWAGRLLKFTD